MYRHSLIVYALFMVLSSPTWAMVDPSTILDVSGGGSFIYNGSFTAPASSSSAPNDVPLFSIQVPFSGSFVLTGVPVGSVKDLTLQLRDGVTNPNISPPGTVPGTTLAFSNIFNAGSDTSPYGIRVR